MSDINRRLQCEINERIDKIEGQIMYTKGYVSISYLKGGLFELQDLRDLLANGLTKNESNLPLHGVSCCDMPRHKVVSDNWMVCVMCDTKIKR